MSLTSLEVKERERNNLINSKIKTNTKTYKEIIISNVFNYFNMIQCILFLLIISVNSYINALFFLVVISNSMVSIIQEIRAKRVLDKLKVMIESKVCVIRDDIEQEISINNLVLDDVYYCQEGMQVPTDSIILDGFLEINESMLTGEIKPQQRSVQDKIFSGTFITTGKAKCKVVNVGKDNYCEKIIHVENKERKETLLKKSINKLIKIIGIFIIPIGLLLFFNQYFGLKIGYRDSIIQTTSALVGMVPSGLIFLTSIALVISVIKLSKKNVLVQELHSIETLSQTSVVCFDKTGTLTYGNLKVHEVEGLSSDFNEVMKSYCYAISVNNNTMHAIREYFTQEKILNVSDLQMFSSDRKYSAVQFDNGKVYYLGAHQVLFKNGNDKLNNLISDKIKQGFRVIVLASAKGNLKKDIIGDDLELEGCIYIKDNLREDAKSTVEYLKNQGIGCKVFSGDDPLTVYNISKNASLLENNKYIDASKYTEQELCDMVEDVSIFGRCTPEKKMMMVRKLKSNGHIVSMIGDGINDIPALKEADLSLALGSGCDATANISNLVLLDNNFSLLPLIIDEGRRIVNNLNNAASMFLIKTIFSILLVLLTLIMAVEYPFTPFQLTVIGSLSCGIPTFLLQFEASTKTSTRKFLKLALMKSFPCAMMIVFNALILFSLNDFKIINDLFLNEFIVIMSAFIYSSSLYFIYSPLSKYRTIIIVSVQFILLILLAIFTASLFNMKFILIILGLGIIDILILKNIFKIIERK
ncbi:MAG: HAD-IC family P-type ATPase [Anaerorhabdus sp.]